MKIRLARERLLDGVDGPGLEGAVEGFAEAVEVVEVVEARRGRENGSGAVEPLETVGTGEDSEAAKMGAEMAVVSTVCVSPAVWGRCLVLKRLASATRLRVAPTGSSATEQQGREARVSYKASFVHGPSDQAE